MLPADQRVFLAPRLYDDSLEVRVNGQLAGIWLWEPYTVEITNLLHGGENVLELCVANTLINLLEAVPRLSGLAAALQLITYQRVAFRLLPVNA